MKEESYSNTVAERQSDDVEGRGHMGQRKRELLIKEHSIKKSETERFDHEGPCRLLETARNQSSSDFNP